MIQKQIVDSEDKAGHGDSFAGKLEYGFSIGSTNQAITEPVFILLIFKEKYWALNAKVLHMPRWLCEMT
jgi:hypothetical protein